MSPAQMEAPESDPTDPAQGAEQNERADYRGAQHAVQALRAIKGEQQATQFLARLHAQQADPDELAVIVSILYGAALRGFCRVLSKAMGVTV